MQAATFGQSIKTVSLLALATLVAVLGVQNGKLKRDHAEIDNNQKYAHKGMWLPDFEAKTMQGEIVRIGAPGKRQILVFLAAGCKYCDASMPFINEMDRFSRNRRDREIEVIGLTKQNDAAMKSFISKHRIKFPVAVIAEKRQLNLLKFGATPTIVAVDSAGRVAYATHRAK